jgi:beta-galactosidase/beta-glucuronidase
MRGDETVHEIQSKVALREVRVDGPRLMVNGRRIKLRGVNHHNILAGQRTQRLRRANPG